MKGATCEWCNTYPCDCTGIPAYMAGTGLKPTKKGSILTVFAVFWAILLISTGVGLLILRGFDL